MTTVLPLVLFWLRLKFPAIHSQQANGESKDKMGTMYIQGKTLCPTLKGWKWRYLVFYRKRLESRVLPWQQLRRSHSLPFVMHIYAAKFEEHCSNISRDIVDWVLYCFTGTITFLICILQKRKYLCYEKRYSKRENAILLYFEKPFK